MHICIDEMVYEFILNQDMDVFILVLKIILFFISSRFADSR